MNYQKIIFQKSNCKNIFHQITRKNKSKNNFPVIRFVESTNKQRDDKSGI